jgi:ADP-ribose pyrophosphatase YjhB (NUDIX family)
MVGNVTPRNPYPTVDVIIETERGIVLVQRRNPPEGWALPGGRGGWAPQFGRFTTC